MTADLIWVLPFAVLLASIAVLPLLQKHWWEKNFPKVVLVLSLIIIAYYFFVQKTTSPLVHSLHEYVSFIALIGSLFIVAGGIHIKVKGEATPMANVLFLLTGAVLANVLGTTGASMVLIRPWLRMNKYRLTTFHVVFFIFIVSNIGGGLTPIGDPPLFLGYLRGVPFFWVLQNVWHIWLVALGILLALFFVLDWLNFQKAPKDIRQKETGHEEEWQFSGMHNVFFLFMIIGAVFINDPPFLREIIMVAAAVLSYKTTKKEVHERNDFNFGPIKEVAILFIGIFITMIPALEWLERNAAGIGIQTARQFFWASGILSSVLDNAPTYLNFLSASIGLFVNPDMVSKIQDLVATHGLNVFNYVGNHGNEIKNTFETLRLYHSALVEAGHVPVEDIQVSFLLANHAIYLKAISVASVFFGAVTYIGNGPNFLVKSIADQSKAKTPSFFGYFFAYSLPVLIPIFFLISFLFFKS